MTNKKIEKQSLTFKILLGMILGLLLGLLLNYIGVSGWIESWIINGLFHIGGKVFIALLSLLVVPLVFVSLVVGTASLEDVRKLGRVGLKTMILYVSTTAMAVALALLMSVLINPGEGLNLPIQQSFQAKEAPPLSDVIINLIPKNPFKAMVDAEMLQIIFFAIFFGLAIALSKKQGERLLHIFQDLDQVIMRMVMMLIHLAPYGVFFLIAKVFATQGFSAIWPLAKYFFLIVFVLILHSFIVYPLLLKFLSGLSPIMFFRKFKSVAAFAFSTSSSNATLPITLENVTTKLGVSNSIASFTIPLGATINMDGTAIMQGVATVFIAQVYGVPLGISEFLMIILTATLASIGTAGVPGVGLITLAMVLRQVNLPTEGIALIIGVDRFLDMARTVVNVTGDAVVTCIVAKSEKQLDLFTYNLDPQKDKTEGI